MDNIQKLIKLHQSLLLLAKIENNQFSLNETVAINEIIMAKCEEKRTFIETKNLQLKLELNEVQVLFHRQLTDMLINNMINNAIRYTPINGEINIQLNKNELIIGNTASAGSLDAEQVFKRFYKPQQQNEGTGLGLAIVHEICRLANWPIQYRFQENKHCFIIQLKK